MESVNFHTMGWNIVSEVQRLETPRIISTLCVSMQTAWLNSEAIERTNLIFRLTAASFVRNLAGLTNFSLVKTKSVRALMSNNHVRPTFGTTFCLVVIIIIEKKL